MHYTDDLARPLPLRRDAFAPRADSSSIPLEPFVNFTMGRTYRLEGDLETVLGWLERATDVSPNYAQGIYARAWTEAMAGRASEGRETRGPRDAV